MGLFIIFTILYYQDIKIMPNLAIDEYSQKFENWILDIMLMTMYNIS